MASDSTVSNLKWRDLYSSALLEEERKLRKYTAKCARTQRNIDRCRALIAEFDGVSAVAPPVSKASPPAPPSKPKSKAKEPEEVDIPDEELMSRIGLKMQIPVFDGTTSKVVVTKKGLLELSRGSVTWPAFKETRHLWSSITDWQRDCRSEGSVVELLN